MVRSTCVVSTDSLGEFLPPLWLAFCDGVMEAIALGPRIEGATDGEFRDVEYAGDITSLSSHQLRGRLVELAHVKVRAIEAFL